MSSFVESWGRPRTRGGLPPWCTWSMMSSGSSPHPRGSSSASPGARTAGPVVPAPAGVFRSRRASRACSRGRPRTRGGLPCLSDGGLCDAVSSPHPRGSSDSGRPRPRRARVVPAPAGVFPGSPPARSGPPGRPRTRGGLPKAREEALAALESSPHPRGSSRPDGADRSPELVVPAPAGVFLPGSPAGPAGVGRPRTRGGLPDRILFGNVTGASSPHPRGSSPPPPPPRQRRRALSGGRPRTRGGLPKNGARSPNEGRSSPHPRGSSQQVGRSPRPRRVVPAPAGVFRGRRPVGGVPRCRPRTRGGLPPLPAASPKGRASSPHPRGSSVRVAVGVHPEDVVPAPAGVFPGPRCVVARHPGRPRTRGGLPQTCGPGPSGGRSSPHPRGSSLGEQRR